MYEYPDMAGYPRSRGEDPGSGKIIGNKFPFPAGA
jgi:hypothetical protein